MYELYGGASRLIGALYRRKDDPVYLQRLSYALNYLPEQLTEDIQALQDLHDINQKKRLEKER